MYFQFNDLNVQEYKNKSRKKILICKISHLMTLWWENKKKNNKQERTELTLECGRNDVGNCPWMCINNFSFAFLTVSCDDDAPSSHWVAFSLFFFSHDNTRETSLRKVKVLSCEKEKKELFSGTLSKGQVKSFWEQKKPILMFFFLFFQFFLLWRE